jgi:hypothetical protein
MLTAEPLVPESSSFDVETATGKMKKYISPRTLQFPAEFIQARGNTIHSEIHEY